uniref:Endonuclease/exonuclease/phosphatase domain-containing protein n=1 Tax=Sus scrofa TaxID=9823 RepID=A0A4X1TY49_PIG
MIKGSIQEEDITILNIYAPNIGSPQYIKQLPTTLKGQINNNTIIVEDFNTPLTAMNRSSRQKIKKERQALNETLDQMDFLDIYRTCHPKATEYTFFSSAHSSQMEHSTRLITSWATSPTSVTLFFFFLSFCLLLLLLLLLFLGPLPRHMEVPRLGVESEL